MSLTDSRNVMNELISFVIYVYLRRLIVWIIILLRDICCGTRKQLISNDHTKDDISIFITCNIIAASLRKLIGLVIGN